MAEIKTRPATPEFRDGYDRIFGGPQESELAPHHKAWLDAHPERSADWLAARTAEGFHVHHIDGDHGNNDQLNLVLIESGDHMMLHNGSKRLLWRPPIKRVAKERKPPVTIEELEAKLEPLIEKRDRAAKKSLRMKLRDIGRAVYAADRASRNEADAHA